MTDYYPYNNRKSLLERCLVDAFKNEWRNQEEDIREKINSKQIEDPVNGNPVYETFSLSRANQSFEVGDSALFTKLTLLFDDMFNIDKEFFYYKYENEKYRVESKAIEFDSTHFNVSQINEKISYTDAIKVLHSFYLSNPNTLYGALLHDGKKFINPLHPLNAQAIAKNHTDNNSKQLNTILDKKYKLIIYTYNDEKINHRTHYFTPNLSKLFTVHILSTLAMLDVQSNFTSKIKDYRKVNSSVECDINEAVAWRELIYFYKKENIDNSEYVSDIYLQPVQLINNGIATPYYGIVAEKKLSLSATSTKGYQLSPMLSCNIGAPLHTHYDNGNVEVSALSVCTGNFSNTSTDGKLSLNHANLGSPYFRTVMGKGAYTFADISVKISLGIYAEILGLTKIEFMEQEEEKVQSFEDYKKKNPSHTLKKYLESIKK